MGRGVRAVSRLGRKASVVALVVAGVLVAVSSSAGAGGRGSRSGGLPAACASLDAPTPPARAVPGSAVTNGPYAIFRRPPVPGDALSADAADQVDTLASYDPTATRLIFTTGVARVYLVRGHYQRLVVPGACLSRLPRADARTLRLLERELAGQAAVCFNLDQTVDQSTSMACVPPAAGTGGYALATVPGLRDLRSSLIVGLVPDGVARVDVRYRTAGTVHGTVRSNVVAYRPPAALSRGLLERDLRGPPRVVLRRLRRLILDQIPTQITWRDVREQVLRTFTPPPALLREAIGGAGEIIPVRGSVGSITGSLSLGAAGSGRR